MHKHFVLETLKRLRSLEYTASILKTTRRDKTGDGACGDVMGREKLFTAVIVGFVAGLNMEKAMEI